MSDGEASHPRARNMDSLRSERMDLVKGFP